MSDLVWVGLAPLGTAVRIFKYYKAAIASGIGIKEMEYSDAVGEIRHSCWIRCGGPDDGHCEICDEIVLEKTGHLHEKVWRSDDGEISVENSIFICAHCHRRQHRSRELQWRRS